jgi:hypothetical protein
MVSSDNINGWYENYENYENYDNFLEDYNESYKRTLMIYILFTPLMIISLLIFISILLR